MSLRKKDKVFLGVTSFLLLNLSIGGWILDEPVIWIITASQVIVLILASQFAFYRRTQNMFSTLLQSNRQAIISEQRVNFEQLESLLSLFSLLELQAPLPKTRGYPASPDFLKMVAELIFKRKPNLILEMGSGVSTLITAYCLKHLGSGNIISLEHDQQFLSISKKNLSIHGLDDIAKIVFAPLKEVNIKGENRLWYDIEQLDGIKNIDMSIIDGPPSYVQQLIRYPALPLLRDRLSDDAIIIMDDGAREDEKKTVELWTREFPSFVYEYVPLEKGAFVIREVSDTTAKTLPAGTITTDLRSEREPLMRLSVIIPCLNAADTIATQLEALADQCWSEPWEVIVADNGSTDGTQAVVERYQKRFRNCRLVDASDRRGGAHARNVGARFAMGEALVFCDADDAVGQGWVRAIGEALAKYDFLASRKEWEKLNPPWLYRNHGRPQEDGLQVISYPPYLPHAGGSGLGVKRLVHEAVGGFDESLPRLMDTDYCFRIQRAGVKLHFVQEAVVHGRYRNTLRGIFHQSRLWAKYNVLMYKRYRQPAERLVQPWRRHADAWRRLVRSLPQLRSPDGRVRWIRRLGWQIGLLQGSIRYLVPPVN
jgi:glycosyltransferase involved in cell wall biosynthesis/predicted O-methyltransferase YrrM